MKKLIITTALFVITACAFAQTTPAINNQAPGAPNPISPATVTGPVADGKLLHLKKDIRRDAKDARADIKDVRQDIKDLKNDIKQRRIDIKNGDKAAAITLTKDIKKDKMNIRKDRRVIRADKRDIRHDIREAKRIVRHAHHINHITTTHKATTTK